jgi:hypothetical protein
MPSNTQRRRTNKSQLLDFILSAVDAEHFQKAPYFPDLLRQPDLIFVPRPGRLTAIYAYDLERIDNWHDAIGCLEDLIEVKLALGEHALVAAIFGKAGVAKEGANSEIRNLLQNSFDSVFWTAESLKDPKSGIQESLCSAPKLSPIMAEFLYREKKAVFQSLAHFEKKRYLELVDPLNKPREPLPDLKRHLPEWLGNQLNRPIERKPMVRNVKGFVGSLERQYGFDFDFGVEGRHWFAIDIIRAGRYGTRAKLRYLMAKARLLRYEVIDGSLKTRQFSLQPILVIDGNIAGPSHDPYRYVRALLSVGWMLTQPSDLASVVEHG